jgi:hypothetical protein
METTREPVQLRQMWSGTAKDHEHSYLEVSFESLFISERMATVWNFVVMVGTNPEHLSVEFCDFVQCHIIVK